MAFFPVRYGRTKPYSKCLESWDKLTLQSYCQLSSPHYRWQSCWPMNRTAECDRNQMRSPWQWNITFTHIYCFTDSWFSNILVMTNESLNITFELKVTFHFCTIVVHLTTFNLLNIADLGNMSFWWLVTFFLISFSGIWVFVSKRTRCTQFWRWDHHLLSLAMKEFFTVWIYFMHFIEL